MILAVDAISRAMQEFMADVAELAAADPTKPLSGQRWLVVGASGMLGQDLVPLAEAAGAKVTAMDLPEIDITNLDSVRHAMNGPIDVVVNCAAYTAVDAAEDDEVRAFQVNALGPANLAAVANRKGARLVQISTDYVFAGNATEPIRELTMVDPKSAYGRTKAAGEWAVAAYASDYLIIRTAWLYGAGGPNFPKTMARLAAERDTLTVVDDQQGQPTWTKDLAVLIIALVEAEAEPGVYHGTASGAVTWHGFAEAVMAAIGSDTTVEPVSSAAFAAKAPRPSYSVLGHEKFAECFVEPIGEWRERWEAAAPEVLGL